MPEVRKCKACGAPSLTPVSRKLEIYNSVIRHECSACGAQVDITPPASIGVITTVSVLALAILGFLVFSGPVPPGWIGLSFFALAILGVAYVTIVPAWVHVQNPIVEDETVAEPPLENSDHHAAKGVILWVERLGVLGGMLAPLLLIVVVLGVATLIGYVNFTYFGN